MALRNFDAVIRDRSNEPLKDSVTGKDITQSMLVWNNLMGWQRDASEDEKLKMYRLACKLEKGGDVDLSVDEMALVKKVSGVLPPLSMGQIFDALEREIPKE